MVDIILEDWDKSTGDLQTEQKYGTRLIVNGKVILEDITTVSALEGVLKEIGVAFKLELRQENMEEQK